MISLVNVGAGSNMKKQDLKELISKIEKLDKFLSPTQVEHVIRSPRGSQNLTKDEKEKEKTLSSKKQSLWGNISGLMNLNNKDNQKQ